MSDQLIDKIVEQASALGLDLKQLMECLNESVGVSSDTGAGQKEVNDDDEQKGDPGNNLLNFTESVDDVSKGGEEQVDLLPDLSGLTLGPTDAQQAQEELEKDFFGMPYTNNNNDDDSDDLLSFGKTAFGKKIISKATESVRQIAKKKGIYIVGRKGKKFLGIRFTKKGNYGKNKKGRPNGKMYTYDGLKKMTNKRVSFKKLPELIDMMNTKAVLKKYKNFKFGFELEKQPRGCRSFGYSFPVGAGYGKRSALLYGKL